MAFPVMTFTEQLTLAAGTLTTELNGGTLHLYTARTQPPNLNSVAADFTEAVYTGYAALTIAAWGSGFRDVGGNAALAAPAQDFFGPADLTGQTVIGCYYLSSVGGHALMFAADFDQPFTLGDTHSLLRVMLQISETMSGWVTTEGSQLP